MGPQMLRSTNFLERAGGAIFDTGGVPTCVTSKSSSVIDFYVGSKELLHVVDKSIGLQACQDGPPQAIHPEISTQAHCIHGTGGGATEAPASRQGLWANA